MNITKIKSHFSFFPFTFSFLPFSYQNDFSLKYIKEIKSLPVPLKWFLLLLFLRPFIDIFWWLKDYHPLLSPLNWAGFLPIPLIIWYLIKAKSLPRTPFGDESSAHKSSGFRTLNSLFDIRYSKIFLAFTFLISLNAFVLLINSYSHSFMQTFGIAIKMISFPLFFLFLSAIISEKHFDLIMKTFLISTIFAFLMIVYELIFGPVNPYTPGGREFERFRGLYSDGINYLIYWLIGLITSVWFYLKNSRLFAFYVLLFTFTLSSFSLFFLNQAVAYFIFAYLFIVILIFVYKKNRVHFLTLTLTLTLILLLLYLPGSAKLASLYRVDAEIIKGKLEVIHGANGRVWIWLEGLKQLAEKPFYSWLFGAGLSGTISLKYFGAGAHSDFIRLLFSSGLTGLLLYLFFIVGLFKGFRSLPSENKFLLLSVIGSLLLLSVTHTPTIYLPFVYFFVAVLAYTLRQ